MKTKLIYGVLIYFIISTGCASKKVISNNYSHKTECISTDLDGTNIVNAWSNKGDWKDAIEQAKKNAINDVLFNGIINNNTNCNLQPVIAIANARLKNDSYFNNFFATNGEYKNYVNLNDSKIEKEFTKNEENTKRLINSGFILKVKTAELKQKMIIDGIIK